jgi:hypothetical protein
MVDTYYIINRASVCGACRESVMGRLQGPLGARRLLRAAGLGFVAAIAGSILWYAVAAITGYEVGFVAIAVGLLVGLAVKRGGEGRGGWKLQALAMILTYSSICASYMPAVWRGMKQAAEEHGDSAFDSKQSGKLPAALPPSATELRTTPSAKADSTSSAPHSLFASALILVAGLLFVFAIACAAPFLAGAQNIIGILLIGFAVYEAWKLNKAPALVVSGPYRVGGAGISGMTSTPETR